MLREIKGLWGLFEWGWEGGDAIRCLGACEGQAGEEKCVFYTCIYLPTVTDTIALRSLGNWHSAVFGGVPSNSNALQLFI